MWSFLRTPGWPADRGPMASSQRSTSSRFRDCNRPDSTPHLQPSNQQMEEQLWKQSPTLSQFAFDSLMKRACANSAYRRRLCHPSKVRRILPDHPPRRSYPSRDQRWVPANHRALTSHKILNRSPFETVSGWGRSRAFSVQYRANRAARCQQSAPRRINCFARDLRKSKDARADYLRSRHLLRTCLFARDLGLF